MDKKQKQHFTLIIYLFVASLSFIIALVSINYFAGTIQAILINVSTELLGVVLIFFLVNRWFLTDSWDTTERIDALVSRLEKQNHLLKGEEDDTSFEKLIAGSNIINLLGYSFVNVLRNRRKLIEKQLHEGVQIKVLLIDPDSIAGGLSSENTIMGDLKHDVKISLSIIRELQTEPRKSKGSIEVRLLNWIPSCGLIITDPDHPKGQVWVTIYPIYPSAPLSERPHFVLKRLEEEYWYRVYVHHYEKLWEMGLELPK